MSSQTKQLHARLTEVPVPALAATPAIEHAITASVAYLGSDAAQRSLEVDPYWPKWDAPWWHMLLPHELGEAARIPARAAAAMVVSLDRLALHSFPIQPGEAPPGTDLSRDIVCHCALGSMYQVRAASTSTARCRGSFRGSRATRWPMAGSTATTTRTSRPPSARARWSARSRRGRRAPGARRPHHRAAGSHARAEPARTHVELCAARGDQRARRAIAGTDPPVDLSAHRPARADRRRPARGVVRGPGSDLQRAFVSSRRVVERLAGWGPCRSRGSGGCRSR